MAHRQVQNKRRCAWLGGAAAALALALAGCGGGGGAHADLVNGKKLFVGKAKCGSCHTLAHAGTSGTIGPNLDDAFANVRHDGFGESVIEGVVRDQIGHPRRGSLMPENLVSGNDRRDVAAYVAHVAAVPGQDTGLLASVGSSAVAPNAPPGAKVFASNGCGGCHTLKAAHSTGTTGPNLDKALVGKNAAFIRQSIVDPNAQIAPGYNAGVMPTTFGTQIPKKDLDDLVKFLQQTAGK